MRATIFGTLALLLVSTGAMAAPVYTTSVTVPYNATAPAFCNPNCVSTSASNNSSYEVKTGADATFFYGEIISTPNSATDQSLQFANIYLGGTNVTNNLILEVTNNRASTTDNPGAYTTLAGTGFSFTQALNDIAFQIPFAYLEANPSNLNYGSYAPGDLIRISLSQSFGYSLISGSSFNATTRLGAQIVPAAAAVPEPLTLSLFGAGLVGAAALRRRKSKKVAA